MNPTPTTASEDDAPIGVIEEGPVDYDDIPMPYSSNRSAWIDKVRETHESSTPYRILVAPEDWETLRSRIRRAVSALDLDEQIDVISRKNRDGNFAVFITPKHPRPRKTPRKGSK